MGWDSRYRCISQENRRFPEKYRRLCALFQRDPKAGLKSDAVDAEQLARRIAGHIEDGKIAHWQVRMKIGATLDD
jgi:hypothetical protein